MSLQDAQLIERLCGPDKNFKSSDHEQYQFQDRQSQVTDAITEII